MQNPEEYPQYTLEWFGPFLNGVISPSKARGIYLIYVGTYPLYVSSSANVINALNKHIFLTAKTIVPMDVRGKEILHYAKLHRQPLIIKTAFCYHNGVYIDPKEDIEKYRQAANAVAFCHGLPCNRYASARFDYETSHYINEGKYFPLKPQFTAYETKDEDDD